ncbi:MAG: peptide deformylase [Candidatus Thorarchaeota archaeon]|jgi:peptide deformylase
MNEEKTETPTTEEEEKKFRLLTIVSDQDIMTLRGVSEPVIFAIGDNSGKIWLDKDTQELIQALKDYVIDNDGLGMAAIQLGVQKRVFVMRKPFNSDNVIAIINPRLIRGEGKSTKAEGCFSIPNLPENVKGARMTRMSRIVVDYTDEEGIDHKEEMLVGMDARIFQHELDHLSGSLIIDDTTPTGKFRGWERLF